MNEETEKTEFEKCFAAENPAFVTPRFFRKYANGDYQYPETHFAWLGFQAAKQIKKKAA